MSEPLTDKEIAAHEDCLHCHECAHAGMYADEIRRLKARVDSLEEQLFEQES